MLGETVLFSIGDLLLGSKAAGAVPPSVLAGAARAAEAALRGQSRRVAQLDRNDGIGKGEGLARVQERS